MFVAAAQTDAGIPWDTTSTSSSFFDLTNGQELEHEDVEDVLKWAAAATPREGGQVVDEVVPLVLPSLTMRTLKTSCTGQRPPHPGKEARWRTRLSPSCSGPPPPMIPLTRQRRVPSSATGQKGRYKSTEGKGSCC